MRVSTSDLLRCHLTEPYSCCWWPLDEKDGTADCGINSRNMPPERLFYVDRKIERSWIKAPIDNPSKAHRDDQAQY